MLGNCLPRQCGIATITADPPSFIATTKQSSSGSSATIASLR
jgi:hypothetical protein